MSPDLSQSRLLSFHYRLMTISRNAKKLIMVLADCLALPLALWSAYALRLADWWPSSFLAEAWLLFLGLPIVGGYIFMRLGLYRAVVRFMGAQAIFAVVKGVVLLALLLGSAALLLDLKPFPRSVPLIFALVALVYVGGSRLLVRSYYHWLISNYVEKTPIVIYGSGGAGVQLSTALAGGKEYVPIGFLDDDAALWGSTVAGLPVFNPNQLQALIEEQGVSHVLLALPSITRAERKVILDRLTDYPVHVKTVPSMADIVSGEAVDALREVQIEDLLGRDPVPPNQELLARSITDKVVMVSGAGGSIGSEICRQVVSHRPKQLLLFEISEYALYTIEQELRGVIAEQQLSIELIPLLGSVADAERVQAIMNRFAVQTIYHAAAYKHVPLVEHNLFEGVRNNSFGTRVMAEAALQHGVERFVLISTDKAVRPTNIMGASKRLAELVLQDLAARSETTIFSMVRFGNVLGSSGSVVPLFQKQIEQGGPVTVTHPEITRFFMTIPEAACLVIQAGSMAQGGDVFVLDMGDSVKIVDLAQRMIRLMGFEPRSVEHPSGVEIQFSGLRPGEKLYEELLIGEAVVGTDHPKIMRAHEERLESTELSHILSELREAMLCGEGEEARVLLRRAVAGFEPSSPLVDWLAEESDHQAIRASYH